MNDMTIVYYTANMIDEYFANNIRKQLEIASNGIPIISVSQKPIEFGENICVGDIGRSHLNVYRQALKGAKNSKTKYIAIAEDDVLYSKEHFKYRPADDVFAYDESFWQIYTWNKPPVFSFKGRRNMYELVCNRELFIDAIEERFNKYIGTREEDIPLHIWAEPGRYERQLGVTINKTERYKSLSPSISFSHPDALGYLSLGRRKRLGENATGELQPWGKASDIIKLYKEDGK